MPKKTVTRSAQKDETAPAAATPILAYKGFNADLTCRDFPFEIGGTYHHEGKVEACESGFHACEHPLDVFSYYPPATSRYCLVELGGQTARHGEDSKIAAAEITIRAELHLPEIIKAAVDYVMARVKWLDGERYASGEKEGVRTTDNGGAATASGYKGAATASGDGGAATASGYKGAATASGDGGAATASGEDGAATASGHGGKVRGKKGNALFLVERDGSGEIIHVWAGIAGAAGIKPDSFYRLEGGKPVEAD